MARPPVPSSSSSSSSPSMFSKINMYRLPLALLSAALFFQLYVVPRAFPTSQYDVIGVPRYSSIEDVKDAYDKLSSKWDSGELVPSTIDFIKIRYAYELLTNKIWKRDYDEFSIDEQRNVIETTREKYAGKSFKDIDLPLLSASPDFGSDAFNAITSDDFPFENDKAHLVLIYSSGSNRCVTFFSDWKRITTLLEDVADNSMVELGEVQLASYLAEKKSSKQPLFRGGLPSLVAFPEGCRSSNCLVRYQGELSVDAVTAWFTSSILGLPTLFYYSKETLVQKFLRKSPHKVKIVFFSETGERATPFLRQVARNYWDYISFAFVLWRKEDLSIWWSSFNVESAPAIAVLKQSGLKPFVRHGPVDHSTLLNILEQNKHQELPQLRSVTSMELGCDPHGYSRAGYETKVWYCVILAGRLSPELSKMRETMRRVQDLLSTDDLSNTAHASSKNALREKRLTFAWLDGEAQEKLCFFYLNPDSHDTCGPNRVMSDVPRLVVVRYGRNNTEEKVTEKPKQMWNVFQEEDADPVSQLVARYNGSDEISEVIQWISKIIKDGDAENLPFFRTRSPPLIPEKDDPMVSVAPRKEMKQHVDGFLTVIYNCLEDPRIGPILLLGALMSFGSIWLQRSQSAHSPPSNRPTQSNSEDQSKTNRRKRSKAVNKDNPSSITDAEPNDASQLSFSDSDSG